MKDDKSCLDKIKSIMAKVSTGPVAGFMRQEPKLPKYDPAELLGIIPADRAKPYDTYQVIERIIDSGSWDEYKAGYGKSLVTGYACVDGWSVGIVANQRVVVKSKKGEMQFGGVIYSDSADKAARFVMNCNQKRIPLVFLQDVTGFMVGSRSEHGGIIKDGAKMVSAVANSVVPKFTFIIGNSYGAGNYAMNGKAYDPRLIFAWPTARIAVMGGEQAAKTLLQIQVSALQKKGEKIDPEVEKKLLAEITAKYNNALSPYYAAARLWVDGIVHPAETRRIISRGIEMANLNPDMPKYNVGVIQT
jgi:acetyl-CoA carboxylase carboxyltransferase component